MAEVTVSPSGAVRVDRVVTAVDVGRQIVNLSGAENQVQGSIIDALSAAMNQECTLEFGRMVQGNFDDYALIRMSEAPATWRFTIGGPTTIPRESASRRCRRSRPRSRIQSLPPPANACASCPGRKPG